MKGTSEGGTERGMDGGREEASGEGIARGKEGAREQGSKVMKLHGRYPAYTVHIHTPSRNAALAIDTL